LRNYFEPRVADNAKNIKCFKDKSGVVFDLRSEFFDNFIESFERLKETDHKIDFDIRKCAELPDLEEDQSYGFQNWRE